MRALMESAGASSGATPPSFHRYRTPQSPWHSPVPYLFGGLAAMLGLIAFALLILACSYWKLSGYLESGEDAGSSNDAEKGGAGFAKPPPVYEEKVVVIMAGEERPTFIATPMSSTAPPFFGRDDNNTTNNDDNKLKAVEEEEEKPNGSDRENQQNQRD